MMSRNFFLITFVWLFSVTASYAQEVTHNSKYAYVDTLLLLSNAPQRSAVEEKLRVESRKMQATLSQMRGDLAELKKKLEDEKNEELKDTLRQRVLDLETLITRRSQTIQETFLLKRNDEISAFQQEINEVIAEVAKRKKIDGVLTQASMVYVNPSIDITQEVMQALKQRFEAKKGEDTGSD